MKLTVKTKSGFEIRLIESIQFDAEVVQLHSIVKATNGKEEFDFQVIARTADFIICKNLSDGTEHAFANDGLQLERFRKYKLTEPSYHKFTFPTYLLIDGDLTIIASSDYYMELDKLKSEHHKDCKIVNRTAKISSGFPDEIDKVNNLGGFLNKGYTSKD